MSDQLPMTVSQVGGAVRHPRRAGFRDGVLATSIVVALAVASGHLALAGAGPTGSAAASLGPPAAAESSMSAAFGTPAPPRASVVGGDQTPGIAIAPATLPPIPPLTLVFLPAKAAPAGTDMVDGCSFLYDFGVDGGGRRYRACPSADGPMAALGVLHAAPGALLLIENSGFTPSTSPTLPPVACGGLRGQPAAFVEDASCQITYAAGTSYEFGFRLPDVEGRWVIAVRGCVAWAVTTCGAWYAEVETIEAAASP